MLPPYIFLFLCASAAAERFSSVFLYRADILDSTADILPANNASIVSLPTYIPCLIATHIKSKHSSSLLKAQGTLT